MKGRISAITFELAKRSFELVKFGNNGKLEGHTDWVRDVAWCPAIGNDYDLLASCSEVAYSSFSKYLGVGARIRE